MSLRVEQMLREGRWVLVFSTVVLPLWLISASAHSEHWQPFWQGIGWASFLLSWAGVLWGLVSGLLIGLWTFYGAIESNTFTQEIWSRLCVGLSLIGFALILSLPGWNWLAELSGASLQTLMPMILKSTLVPLGVFTFSVLARQFMRHSIGFLCAIVATLLLLEFVYPDLVV